MLVLVLLRSNVIRELKIEDQCQS